MVGPVSLTTMPVPFRKKRARHERHQHSTECSACFRLRFADGRFAPAAFRKGSGHSVVRFRLYKMMGNWGNGGDAPSITN